MAPLLVQAGAAMPPFGACTREDEARAVWKWIGENGEYANAPIYRTPS